MRRWGEPATEAVSTELEQLHYRDTFEPVNHRSLSKKEYEKVLESHLFLKQKRDESIKGRMVAGGNKQRGTIDKEDAASPTAALESVLLKSTIDAAEERDFAVIDIPNAFIVLDPGMYEGIQDVYHGDIPFLCSIYCGFQ